MKKFLISMLLILSPIFSEALSSINVSADINQDSAFENLPLSGTLLVTHDKKDKVDTSSFRMNGKPLQVEFIKDIPFGGASSLIVSTYSFQMPGLPSGLHLVPEINVKIGGKTYTSISTGFEVKSGKASAAKPSQHNSPQQQPSPSPDASVILKIEAFYDGPPLLYPGQRGWVGYKYEFNTSISLTEEKIPLLDVEGFKKVGAKKVEDSTEGNFDVRVIKQEFEAVIPGKFTFSPATIEGYPYQIDSSGQKQVFKQKVSAQSNPITITVAPFPEGQKPKSFTGAIGQYTMSVQMLTPNVVRVGDRISLAITFEGLGDLSTVKAPELCCQPGFSGVFRASDIPSVGEISGQTKRFVVEIYPLTDAIKAIPPIEFTAFNTIINKYTTIKSNPIPITIKPNPTQEEGVKPITQPKKGEKENAAKPLGAIEIRGNYALKPEDLHNLPFGNWWTLIFIPIIAGLIYLQHNIRKMAQKISKEPPKESAYKTFSVIIDSHEEDSEFYYLLNRSFMLLLKEKGWIDTIETTPYKLPATGIAGEVREYLVNIEENRFRTPNWQFTDQDREEAKALFKKVEDMEVST